MTDKSTREERIAQAIAEGKTGRAARRYADRVYRRGRFRCEEKGCTRNAVGDSRRCSVHGGRR